MKVGDLIWGCQGLGGVTEGCPVGFPGVSVYKEIACNAGDIPLLGWEDPLEEGMETHSSILAGESHGWRSVAGYSP